METHKLMKKGAEEIARRAFGKDACVQCNKGQTYADRTPIPPYKVGYLLGALLSVKGRGNSWEEAFEKAGVKIEITECA